MPRARLKANLATDAPSRGQAASADVRRGVMQHSLGAALQAERTHSRTNPTGPGLKAEMLGLFTNDAAAIVRFARLAEAGRRSSDGIEQVGRPRNIEADPFDLAGPTLAPADQSCFASPCDQCAAARVPT
jgi:hypothetical protein